MGDSGPLQDVCMVDDMMEVWPNPPVYLGSQKEGNSCIVSVPCFKVWCLVLHLEGTCKYEEAADSVAEMEVKQCWIYGKLKKRVYEQAKVERRGNFTPIVLSVDGLLHRETEHFL